MPGLAFQDWNIAESYYKRSLRGVGDRRPQHEASLHQSAKKVCDLSVPEIIGVRKAESARHDMESDFLLGEYLDLFVRLCMIEGSSKRLERQVAEREI